MPAGNTVKQNRTEVIVLEDRRKGLTRKKAILLILLIAAVLTGLILGRSGKTGKSDCSMLEGRLRFLSQYGWEVDPESEEHKSVIIPDSLAGIIDNYNDMQLEQGFDLRKHLGVRCEQYSYTVKNYPGSEQRALATLYVQGRQVIAGDVHSTALNGFMQGLKLK